MDLFGRSNYKHLRLASSLVGVWPYEETTYSRLRRTFFAMALLYYLIMSVLRMITTNADLEVIVQIIPAVFSLMISNLKFVTIWVRMRAIRNLFDWMKHDWETVNSTDELCILRNYDEHARFCVKTYLLSTFLIGLSMVLLQFWPNILDIVIPLNESRPHFFVLDFVHFVNPDEHYYVVGLDIVALLSIHLFSTCVFDMFLVIPILHACGICQVLRYRFDRMYRSLKPHKCNNKTKCFFRKEVEQCIYKHWMLKSFVDHINECYVTNITIQLVLASVTWISILSYSFKKFVTEHFFSSQIVVSATYIVAYTLNGLFYTIIMQLLRDNSWDLHNRIIIGKWNEACRPIQKLLIFLMQHSAKDLCIYFAHKIPVSNEAFLIVIKILGSYMMALASLYTNESDTIDASPYMNSQLPIQELSDLEG